MNDLVEFNFEEEAGNHLPPGWSVQSWSYSSPRHRLNVIFRHDNGTNVMLELDNEIQWKWVLALLAVAEVCPTNATFCFERRVAQSFVVPRTPNPRDIK